MKYAELAQKIVELLGGKSNIRQATHCATRLRFIVKEESAIQEQALRQLPGVLEVNQRMGEIQVVIGNEVQNVYYAVNKLVGDSESTTVKERRETGCPGSSIRSPEFLPRFYQRCAAARCCRPCL